MNDDMEDDIFKTWPAKANAFPKSVTNHPSHKEALEFLQSDGNPSRDYSWAYEYAKSLWEHRTKVFAIIDDKADSIIKYLGGGTGIFALGIIAKVDSSNAYLAFWCLPAVVCALTSICFAVSARRVREVPSPPTVSQAIKEYVDSYDTADQAKAAFLGQWNLACVDMQIVCDRKSWFVEKATSLYFWALALLVVPLLVAIAYPPTPAK
jgi:hypothetical protein